MSYNALLPFKADCPVCGARSEHGGLQFRPASTYRRGIAAYSELQQAELLSEADGYTATRHQRLSRREAETDVLKPEMKRQITPRTAA